MKKLKYMSVITVVVAVLMISIGMVLQSDFSTKVKTSSNIYNFKIQNMAASANMIVQDTEHCCCPMKEIYMDVCRTSPL